MKLGYTHQLLVYANDVNILGASIHNIRKSTEALVVASKEIGLEVNAGNTKYMVIHVSRTERRSKQQRADR